MTRKSTWIMGLVGAGLLGGCASTSKPPLAESRVVPYAKIRDAADSADGYYALGRELQRSGKFDDAERAYRLALEMDSNHIDARNGLAAVSVNRGDLDLALSILQGLVANHPDQPHLLTNLGYAHYLKGNYFDARVALEQSVTLDPANQRTRDKLKAVMKKLGVPESHYPEVLAEMEPVPDPVAVDTVPAIVSVAPGVYQLKPAKAGIVVSETRNAPEPQVLIPAKASSEEAAPAPATKVVDLAPVPARQPVPADPPQAPVSTARMAQVEIINGNGVSGLARSLRALVHGSEWQVVRVANHARFNVPMTRIEYAPGNQEAAQYLAKDLQVNPVYRYNEALGSRVRVVLGYDLRSIESLRQRAPVGKLAAAD